MRLRRRTAPGSLLWLRSRAQASDGFGLVELMIAIVVFAVLSAAVLTTLNFAIGLTRANRNRVAASNLAARELEIVRRDFSSATRGPQTIALNAVIDPTPLPGGTAGEPLVVDNVSYTVTRTAQWTTTGAAAPASPCDDGSSDELTAMKVHVEVTWTNMGSVSPIVADTLLTPRKGTYSSTTGHIAVKVINRNGVGAGGHTVTISGPSGTISGATASDGCALFAFLTPGSYTVSVSTSGYVDRQGGTTPTTTAVVSTAQIWKGTFDYARAATINATFVKADASHPLPAVMDLTLDLGNAGLLPAGSISRPGTGVTRSVGGLWPYLSGYQLWAGDCLDSDPLTTGDPRADPVTTSPGGTVAADVDLGALDVKLRRGGAAVAGRTIIAVHQADSSCSSGDLVTLGTTDGVGKLSVSLPYGTWELQSVGDTPMAPGWPSVTIRRGGPTPPINVRIA